MLIFVQQHCYWTFACTLIPRASSRIVTTGSFRWTVRCCPDESAKVMVSSFKCDVQMAFFSWTSGFINQTAHGASEANLLNPSPFMYKLMLMASSRVATWTDFCEGSVDRDPKANNWWSPSFSSKSDVSRTVLFLPSSFNAFNKSGEESFLAETQPATQTMV